MITLEPLSSNDINSACLLYETAFPLNERRSTSHWINNNKSKQQFHILCIKQNNHFKGILTYWQFNSFCYIEHFAICTESRGTGIGSAALKLFSEYHVTTPIVLEVEPDCDSITHRRIIFYEKLHFRIIPIPYKQPPYHQFDDFLALNIMSNNYDYTLQNFTHIAATIYKNVYNV